MKASGVEGVCFGGNDSDTYLFDLTTTVGGAVVYAAASMRLYSHEPGLDYTERAEVSQGSGSNATSPAVEDKTVVSASLVVVDGMFDRKADWGVIGLEIKPD